MSESFISNEMIFNKDLDSYHKFLFNRSLLELSPNSGYLDDLKDRPSVKPKQNKFIASAYSENDKVITVEYHLNDLGYRSSNFDKDNEVLILGCSQTYGSGLPNQFTWADIFCNLIGKSYSRIATPGDSINGQVYKAFKYFEEIGNPKVVIGIFPLERLEYTKVKDKFITNTSHSNEKTNSDSIDMAFFDNQLLKFSKIPHDPSYVIPKQFVIFYNFMFIKMLEQYCESHNIKFIWSIYDDDRGLYESAYQKDKNTFRNYLRVSPIIDQFIYLSTNNNKAKIEYGNIMKEKHKECHKEFKDHVLYDWAADYEIEKGQGHWGIHINQHIAESVNRKYKEIKK